MIEVDTSCVDWEKRILAGESLITAPPIFPDAADYALNIFKELRIVDLLGRPTIGEVTRDWIFDFAGAFFGSLDEAENIRHITEFFLLISKKNTKSTIASGLMMTVLILNQRESAEFLILAPTKDAANNVYKPAADMVRADDELKVLFQVQDHLRTITHRNTKAQLKVVAADSDTVSGSKATGVLIDELWAFGKKARAASMLTEATGGLMSRPEGFIIYLTTQSDEPPAGVFLEKLRYARAVRDGTIRDPRFLPVIYEFPPDMIESKAYLDPKNYYITNPNLGASVSVEMLERKLEMAKQGGDESIQEVVAKHLNVEIGLNLRSNRWSGVDYWELQQDSSITLETLLERCEVIDVGIDGGGLDDLLGVAVIGREKGGRKWLSWCQAYAHKVALERRKQEAPRFNDFKRAGDMVIVDRIGDDVELVCDIVEQIDEAGLLDKVGVDPVGIGAILDALDERGIDEEKIIGISQGWKLGGAIKTAERRLGEGLLIVADQALMRWCAANARVEPRGNAILITKQASGNGKIDPLMGFFNAISLISLNPPAACKKYQMLFV